MSHNTLIGGTSYEITGGRTLIGSTGYDVTGGRTLIGGTGYDISFVPPPTAMLYSDGNFVFQVGDEVVSGKTLIARYTGFEDMSTPPWNSKQTNFTSVNFDTVITPTSMAYWFFNARTMVASMSNFTNLVVDNVTNMYSAYMHCIKLTGSPVCGSNVTDMIYAYYNCRNITGSPVCGNNVTSMHNAYRHCFKLTGSPVCGPNVTDMTCTYYNCKNLTGLPVFGNNVINAYGAYFDCSNLKSGNTYVYATNIVNAHSCFKGKNNYRRYNLFVPAGSTTLNTFLINSSKSLVGAAITWTQSGTTYYNTAYNIYIYATL